jgi:hypothetical protein
MRRLVLVLGLLFFCCAPAHAQWGNGYTYRRTINIPAISVSTDQSNFPVLVSGTYSYLATTANGGNVTNASGYDIIFTSDSAGASILPFERTTWSATSGAVEFWVKVATLSHSTSTVIYEFYNNAAVTTDQSNPTGTWDSNFVGVWHLPNGTSLGLGDSTSHANNGTNSGTAVTAGTGKIDGAGVFGGSSYIDVPAASNAPIDNLFSGNNWTLECWAKPTSTSTLDQNFMAYGTGSSAATDVIFIYGLASANTVSVYMNGWYTFSHSMSAADWQHVAVTYSSGTLTAYYNGAAVGSPATGLSNATATTAQDFWIGVQGSGLYNNWTGSLDEVRISNSTRSADWLATENANQNSPSTFYSVGGATTSGGSTVVVRRRGA